MKKLIVVIFAFIPLYAFSQEKLSFNKVISVDTVNKNNIYLGLKEWFALNFVSSKNVIELEDKDAALIIGNATTEYSKGSFMYACYKGWLNYTIKIQCRDNRFRVEVTNFRHEIQKENASQCELGILTTAEKFTDKGMERGTHNKVWKELKIKSEEIANLIFSKLDKVAFSNLPTEQNDDW